MSIKEKILDEFEKEFQRKYKYFDEQITDELITIEFIISDEEREEFLKLNYFDDYSWGVEVIGDKNVLSITKQGVSK